MRLGLTASRNWTTSAGLRMTGKVWGCFGAGITAATDQGFWRVTVSRKRSAATATMRVLGASCFSRVSCTW